MPPHLPKNVFEHSNQDFAAVKDLKSPDPNADEDESMEEI